MTQFLEMSLIIVEGCVKTENFKSIDAMIEETLTYGRKLPMSFYLQFLILTKDCKDRLVNRVRLFTWTKNNVIECLDDLK